MWTENETRNAPAAQTRAPSPTNSASSRHSTCSITSNHPEQDPEEALARNQNPKAQVRLPVQKSQIIPLPPETPVGEVEDNVPNDVELPGSNVEEFAPSPALEHTRQTVCQFVCVCLCLFVFVCVCLG